METFSYIIVDENNVWRGFGSDATEEILQADLKEINNILKEEGYKAGDVEILVYKLADPQPRTFKNK
jgi:cupin superfamily acireductone dioxygenase involved in methionine salvage